MSEPGAAATTVGSARPLLDDPAALLSDYSPEQRDAIIVFTKDGSQPSAAYDRLLAFLASPPAMAAGTSSAWWLQTTQVLLVQGGLDAIQL